MLIFNFSFSFYLSDGCKALCNIIGERSMYLKFIICIILVFCLKKIIMIIIFDTPVNSYIHIPFLLGIPTLCFHTLHVHSYCCDK